MTAEARGGRRLGPVPELTGLRGVAIALVFVYHALEAYRVRTIAGGWVGVDIFFVLSGFLITALLLNEWDAREAISLARFYARRALRLVPALVVFLAVAAAVIPFIAEPVARRYELRGVVAAVLYVANFLMAFRFTPSLVSHTWSLSMEEQFYLVWPLSLVLALRLGARRWTLVGIAAGGALAIAVARFALLLHGEPWSRLYYSPLHSDGLLIGCALGIAFATGILPSGRVWRGGLAAAVAASSVFLGWVVWAGWPRSRWLYEGGLVLTALAAAVLVLAAAERNPAVAALRFPPLVYLGKISYALYLWHFFFLFGFSVFHWGPLWSAIVCSLAAASASYHLVERPFLLLKRRVAPTKALAEVVVEPATS